MGEPEDILGCWSGGGVTLWETVLGDGARLCYEVGAAGDHRFVYGDTSFHIDVGGGRILCAPRSRIDFAWQRQLLDTVLFSVSFTHGFELLHASAIATSRGAVAILGPSGSGKSSLAAELVDRGYRLFSDDVLAIDLAEGRIISFPAPAVMNLPAERANAKALGSRLISRFPEENELWVVIPDAATDVMPLTNLFVLDGAGRQPGVNDIDAPSFLEIAPYAISLPHGSERARRRFDVLSNVVDLVSVRRLSRGVEGTPHQLADLVERSLEEAFEGR